ncbi:hypothetical protein HYALB_00005789 [Hymenoscyphus albidus]|uniref:Uncharacterized protein n=1 Tax=Hymenoscyphus albidus TaxID=595503 RepID=A0A9N9LR03_9HELO|nr:hypothetical protein HYALB_00005789 [Hymenoscyphus albidus]
MSSNNISGMFKTLKTQVKTEVGKLVQPRPQQPLNTGGPQQQRPPQPYGQQQQQYPSGPNYNAGNQPQQSQHYAQVQYQTQPQQQQPQNVQYVTSPQIPQQYPQLAKGQVYSSTPQPQMQSQFQAPLSSQPRNSQTQLQQYAPTPQVHNPQTMTFPQQTQTQFQPQYQIQQHMQVGHSLQISPSSPVSLNQSPSQFQPFAPQFHQNTQAHQQPLATGSPGLSHMQEQEKRQSQAYNQPQNIHTQAVTPQPYQNVSPALLQHTPPQSQMQSPVASLARLSLYNQSPVQQQTSNVTSHQSYQPMPPMGPPPPPLVQSSPPAQQFNQAQVPQHHQQYAGQALPATTISHTQQQAHLQSAPQQQIYNSIPSTGSPAPQLNQYQPITQQYAQSQVQSQTHTPSPTQIASQPHRQSQQYTSSMQTPAQIQAQPLQYTVSPGQIQSQPQVQPQYITTSAQNYQATPVNMQNTYSFPGQTLSPIVQHQQNTPSPTQQLLSQSSSPQSQFHSQVRNSIRRKPHPSQSPKKTQASQTVPQTTDLPHATIQSQIQPTVVENQAGTESNIILTQAHVTSPRDDSSGYHSQIQGGTPPTQARLTSPPNDPSLHLFHKQEPVELSAQPEQQVRNAVVEITAGSESQNVIAAMDPPQIESEFRPIETVAPKPIHPPAPIEQYVPSSPPQISSKESVEAHTDAVINLANSGSPPISTQVVKQQADAKPPGDVEARIMREPVAIQPQIQPINTDLAANLGGSPVQTPPTQLPKQETPKPLPHYQAFSPSSQLQSLPLSESMPTQFQGPDAHPIHPVGQHQYQPYSPLAIAQPSDYRGSIPQYRPQPQAHPQPQPTNEYQNYDPYSTKENRAPIPPPGPPPLHLQNQTPPPGFARQEAEPQTQVQEINQARRFSQSREIPHTVYLTQHESKLPPCSGKKEVLTKYTKFYVPINSLVPRLDPSVQELSHAICETCYLTQFSPIPSFATALELYNSPDIAKPESQDVPVPSSRAMCQFGLNPSLLGTFRDHCLPQNSLSAFISSIGTLNSLPQCPGNDPMDGGEYYTTLAIPGSSFCVKCFDSYIKPSSFGSHFTMKLNGPGQKWTCDNGRSPGFPSRLLEALLNNPIPDFDSLTHALNGCLQALPCAGIGTQINAGPGGRVIVYSIPGADINICSECFYSRVKMTLMEQHFKLAEHDSTTSSVTCDLASGVSKFLFMIALQANDLQIWQQGLHKFNRLPKCEGVKGVGEEIIEQQNTELGEDAKWYHITEYPNIEACPSCFHAIISPLGASHLFNPIIRQLRASMVRTCNFSIGNEGIISSSPDDFPNTLEFRGFILRHLLEVAWESNHQDFAPFLSIAKSLSECAPPCGSNARGYKSPNGRRWFGHVATNASDDDDTTIVMCQECFETRVKDTCLEPFLGTDLTDQVYAGDTQNQKEAFCGPFSKVSKQALNKARE